MRQLLTAIFLLAWLAACATPEPPAAPWHWTDLSTGPMQVEDDAGRRPAGQEVRTSLPRGRSEVRDLDTPDPRSLGAGRVKALLQTTGSRLVSRRELLGEEAFFSFVPLSLETAPCPCTYHVGIRIAGQDQELASFPAEAALEPPPKEQVVSLADFAGQTVQLVLRLEGPAGGQALWGSPGIASRRPLETAAGTPGEDEPINVVLIGVDTLRADVLGAYGQRPSLTPAIDRLSEESDLWLWAFSTFNSTNPSFTSILTGRYGKDHGVYGNRTALPPDSDGLARRFAAAGYATMASLAARHPDQIAKALGFETVIRPWRHAAGEMSINHSISWISRQDGPFFAWIHLFDPHTPHTPPRPYALGYRPSRDYGMGPVEDWQTFREPGPRTFDETTLGGQRDLYDGEVAYTDHQVGRLMDFLASRGLLRNTLVAFVADHGENLGDHGVFYNHTGLWDSTVRVPLIIRWPGESRPGRRLEGLIQTIDLFPNLLAAAGIAPLPEGAIDLRQMADEGVGGRRVVFAEHANLKGAMVRTRQHKFMRLGEDIPDVPAGDYLYDLENDPGEEHNLATSQPELTARLADTLERWLADRQPPLPTQDLDPESEARLRALGYIR